METTREDGDRRSTKRQHQAALTSQPSGLAGRAVAALDAAVWTNVIEFLPMPKELDWVEQVHHQLVITKILPVWPTLLNLRLVTKELAALLHPVNNKALWKKLLLQGFDFSVGGYTINCENYQDDHGISIPSDEVEVLSADEEENELDEDEDHETESHNNVAPPDQATTTPQEPSADQGEQDPQVVAMRGRYFNMPPNYLEEDLVNWHKLGIFHRPSQYGFLTTLQQQPPVGEWPETEDPFTLFGDLVRLLMLPHGDSMEAGGEAGETMLKFLAAPTEANSSSEFFEFYVMKTLGYVPHFWHWGRSASGPWKGFTDPEAFEAAISNQAESKDEDDFDKSREVEFPMCNVGDARQLYQKVHQYCKDWRAACCNSNSDGETPVFYVGESKAAPHRWIGYASTKCWT